MTSRHPALPAERPLAIAHRAGNSIAAARAAAALGADMIETDVWLFRSRLELRHVKTMGPVPLLWDRWELHPGWRPRLMLADLALALDAETRLFLDLKGKDLALAPRVVETIRRVQPERRIILCGRNWAQLDAVRDEPDVWRFYSVGSEEELATVTEHLHGMEHPAISIHARFVNESTMATLKAIGATVVAWAIYTNEGASRMFALGVDGFTTETTSLIERIVRHREAAFSGVDVCSVPTHPWQ